MIFGDMRDSHDKRADALIDKLGDQDDSPLVTNLNLVGIRRRLNNIEVGISVLVALAAINTWRHW